MSDETPTTVEAVLSEQYGVEGSSLFSDEPVAEEAVEEAVEDVVEDEEAVEEDEVEDEFEEGDNDLEEDEDLEEEEAEEEEDSSNSQLEEVAANLKKAMQSERSKRKAATEKVAELEGQLELLKANKTDSNYDALIDQIKELGLEDVLDIKEEAKLDPRVQEYLDAQEQAKAQEAQAEQLKEFQENMRTDVKAKVGQYKNIDTSSPEQGQVLASLIVASVVQGAELDDAVDSSLKSFNAILGAGNKRQPKVKPRQKVKSATKTTQGANVRKQQKQAQNGDFRAMFDKIGKDLAHE